MTRAKVYKKRGPKKKGSGPGRKSKKTEDTLLKLEEIFMLDGTLQEACAFAGISDETYYRRYSADEEFALRMDQAKHYVHTISRRAVTKNIEEGDVKLAFEFLKRRDDRYSDKIQQQTTTVDATTELTEEQKKAIAARFTTTTENK